MCHVLRSKMFSPAFLRILFCFISTPVEFSLHIKQKAMTKSRLWEMNTFILWLFQNGMNPVPAASHQEYRAALLFLMQCKFWVSTYLEQLHSNTSKHELQQCCNNHDITNSSNSHKDTLNNMLERKKPKLF